MFFLKFFQCFLIIISGSVSALQAITLDEAIVRALQHNPDLTLARYDITRAHNNREAVKDTLLPKISQITDFTKQSWFENQFTSTGSELTRVDRDRYNMALSLQQPLYDFTYASRSRAEEHRYQANLFAYNEVERNVVFRVIQYFYALKQHQDIHTILQDDIRRIISHMRLLSNKMDLGFQERQDILKLQMMLHDIRHNDYENRKAAQNIIFDFRRLLALPNEDPLVLENMSSDHTLDLTSPIPLDIDIETIIKNNPEWQKLNEAQLALEDDAHSIHKQAFPQLRLLSNYGYLDEKQFSLSEEDNYWNIVVQSQWDIFNGGQRKRALATTDIQKQDLTQQRYNLEEHIVHTIQEAYQDFCISQTTWDQCRTTVELSEELLEDMNEKIQQQTILLEDTLALWLDHSRAQQNYIAAKWNYHMAKARYLYTVNALI